MELTHLGSKASIYGINSIELKILISKTQSNLETLEITNKYSLLTVF